MAALSRLLLATFLAVAAPALGLAELRPRGKVHALHLSAAGVGLRDRLDATIVQATTIT